MVACLQHQKTPEAMPGIYARASVLLWPGVNEAFGMTYLEAQASGLTIVAQDRPGVRDVVHTPLVPVEDGAAGLAARIGALLRDPGKQAREGTKARTRIASDHLLPNAARILGAAIRAPR